MDLSGSKSPQSDCPLLAALFINSLIVTGTDRANSGLPFGLGYRGTGVLILEELANWSASMSTHEGERTRGGGKGGGSDQETKLVQPPAVTQGKLSGQGRARPER